MREIVWMRQGLTPAYAHDEEGAEDRAEAHAEDLTCTSCYRSAFRRRRCIIPADRVTDLQHGLQQVTALCSLSLVSGAIFGLGGVWETWQNDNGHSLQTFAVVTARASFPLQQFADRVSLSSPRRTRTVGCTHATSSIRPWIFCALSALTICMTGE